MSGSPIFTASEWTERRTIVPGDCEPGLRQGPCSNDLDRQRLSMNP